MINLTSKTSVLKALPLISLGFASCSADKAADSKLNVIFILTDDQGYGDLGCYGNPWLKTPNLDKLHSQSVSFTNFHSGTTSAPTRSGLMTGKYGNTTGVWHTILGRSILDLEETTMAEVFSETGYATAMFGKWHLGDGTPYRPFERGFDLAITHGSGGIGQTPDYWENDYFDDVYYRNGEPVKYEGYCTDVWFAEALKFIKENKDNPFFCYIPTNAPHSPYHVAEEWSAPYEGIDEIPNPSFYGMIANLDMNVGKLQAELKTLGLHKNTVVIFMTDNGGSGGVDLDQDAFLKKGYNAGMRGRKAYVYEGGHRVPLFMSIPGKKAAEISDLTSYMDIMPTLMEMCGLSTDKEIEFDGTSLMPLIKGEAELESRIICVDTQRGPFLEKYKSYCVMQDSWRLVNGTELYDLSQDPEQRNNIIEQHPEKAELYRQAYEAWWERNSVRANCYQYISVHDTDENVLTAHDLHVQEGRVMPPWNQSLIRTFTREYSGFWALNIPSDGTYRFELMRWPPETNLNLYDVAPAGEPIPNGKAYAKGKKLNMNGANISIADKKMKQKIASGTNPRSVDFEMDLKQGDYKLEANFTYPLNKGDVPANYVRITKIK